MPKFLDVPSWYEGDASYSNSIKTQNGKFKRNVFVGTPATFSLIETPNSTFNLTSSQVKEGGEFEGISSGDYIIDYANQTIYIVSAVSYLSAGDMYYISIQAVKRHLYAVKFYIFTYATYVYTYIWSNKYYTQSTMTVNDLCSLLSYQGEEFPATGYSGSPYASMAMVYAIKPTNSTSGNIQTFLVDAGESTSSNRFYSASYSTGLMSVQSVKQII